MIIFDMLPVDCPGVLFTLVPDHLPLGLGVTDRVEQAVVGVHKIVQPVLTKKAEKN